MKNTLIYWISFTSSLSHLLKLELPNLYKEDTTSPEIDPKQLRKSEELFEKERQEFIGFLNEVEFITIESQMQIATLIFEVPSRPKIIEIVGS